MKHISLPIFLFLVLSTLAACTLEPADLDKNASGAGTVLALRQGADAAAVVRGLGGQVEGQLDIGERQYILASGLKWAEAQEHKAILQAEATAVRRLFQASNDPHDPHDPNDPNDPYYRSQYAPQQTALESVWPQYTGRGIKVAIIDSGINTLHEDFGTGAFAPGYDLIKDRSYPSGSNFDQVGHGTHVAGIVAARRNNHLGIVGAAPEAILLPFRVTGASNGISSFHLAAAITRAADAGVQVINMSLGGPVSSAIESEAVRYALSKNIVLVAAAGNDGLRVSNYPASFPGVIAVAASNGRGQIARFSSRNELILVAAPGADIYSLAADSNNAYTSKSGTSMATPFVSGIVALLKQKFPTATPAQIAQILQTTAKDIDKTGRDDRSGYGLIQPARALAANLPTTTAWKEFTFQVRHQSGQPQKDFLISLFDTANRNTIYTLYTNAQGQARGYLPAGNYNYRSSFGGTPHQGTLNLAGNPVKITLP